MCSSDLLLEPKFNWTSSVYEGSDGWKNLIKIPTEIDSDYLSQISPYYCAILFDSNFSQYQIDRKASLEGGKTVWPGLKLQNDVKVDYKDSRFSVVILKND